MNCKIRLNEVVEKNTNCCIIRTNMKLLHGNIVAMRVLLLLLFLSNCLLNLNFHLPIIFVSTGGVATFYRPNNSIAAREHNIPHIIGKRIVTWLEIS